MLMSVNLVAMTVMRMQSALTALVASAVAATLVTLDLEESAVGSGCCQVIFVYFLLLLLSLRRWSSSSDESYTAKFE